MRKIPFILFGLALGFASSPTLCAQDPDLLLNRLSEKAQTYSAYEIAYSSTLVDLKNDFELTQTGMVQSKATAFTFTSGTMSFTATEKPCGPSSLK